MTSYQHDGAGPLSRRLVLGLLGFVPVAVGAVAVTGGSAQASPVLLAYRGEHIFARADMTRSDFYTKPQWPTDPDIAHPYSSGTKGAPAGPLTDITSEEDSIGSPAGNAFSTAPDMVRFAQALTGGRLLSPAWADLMTSGKVPLSPQQARDQPPSQLDMVGYGPDIRIVNDQIVFGHTGGGADETTYIGIYPNLDWVAVILSNYNISNEMGSLLQLQDQLITQHAAS